MSTSDVPLKAHQFFLESHVACSKFMLNNWEPVLIFQLQNLQAVYFLFWRDSFQYLSLLAMLHMTRYWEGD